MFIVLVLLTLAVAIAVEIILAKRRAALKVTNGEPVLSTSPMAMMQPSVPKGLFIDQAHSWVRVTRDGSLRVGVDSFLTEALGDISSVVLPALGKEVKRGDPLLELRVAGRVLSVPSPATGKIVDTNRRLASAPWLMVHDPYGVGWAVSVWATDRHAAVKPLKIGQVATRFLREEVGRLADLVETVSQQGRVPTAADGGLPARGSAMALSDERWEEFSAAHLSTEAEEPAE